jgi:DNA-binding MarR family transcriptional regulator
VEKVQDCIFFQLAKASQSAARFWAKKVDHLGVTAAQAMVLNFLGDEDCIPSHILGQKLKITSATMTGILDRLEKMDLIERKRHPEDRRAILVCLTSQGLIHAKEINAIMISANDAFLNELSPEQSLKFKGFLKHVWMERS